AYLGVEVRQMRTAVDAEQILGGAVGASEVEEMAIVALADGFPVGTRREALSCVLADRLEHLEARRPRSGRTGQQALRHEAVEDVQRRAGHGFGRSDRRAAREHGETREARLLSEVEEVVTPV